MLTKEEWKTTSIIALTVLALWAIWYYMRLADDYVGLNDSYNYIVEQMEQVIVDKNLEIDQLNAQIKELKEVK